MTVATGRAPHAALLAVLGLVALLLAAQPQPPTADDPTSSAPATPLAFVANAGQTDPSARYMARGPGHAFWFTPRKAVLDFRRGERGVALELSFRGANPKPEIVAERRAPGRVSFVTGAERHANLARYEQLRYRGLWPGIDMVFRGQGGTLKYEFHVSPGADPRDIRLAYAGADSLTLTPGGALAIGTPLGALRDAAPRSAQGGRAVESHYVVAGSSYGFALGAYDRSRPLLIDPGLLYGTYLGGIDGEIGDDVEVDSAGNAYVAGQTRSASFPTTPGAHDTVVDGVYDVFVTKLDGSGSILYSTYLGGSGDEHTPEIEVGPGGRAYVTGFSTSANFPTTPGAYDGTLDGSGQHFLVALDAAGSNLEFATFLPGGQVTGIAVDGSGRTYTTGTTFSGTSFPVSAGAPDTTAVSSEAFVARMNASGSTIDWATYIGGRGEENARAIDLDGAGEPYVVGRTTSVEEFPFTPGAYDTVNESESFFVTKVDGGGTAFDYSTLLGNGINPDIAVDAAGHAHVAGTTGGPPTTPGAYDTDGCSFIAKLNPTGSGLVYSTRLGEMCNVATVDVDSAGNAYATQLAQTSDTDLPTTPGAFDTTRNDYDGFVFKLNSTGTGQLYGSYLGGSAFDGVSALAPVGANSFVVTGHTESTDFPTTPGSHDQSHNGSQDGFVLRLQTYDGYPRPKGATPIRFSLVTAYKFRSCSSSQELIHGPPLAYSSCPPQKESQYATVGTGDSNGLPARNEGWMRFDAQLGTPATPADEADVRFEFFIDDVFNIDLTDYTAQLRILFSVRMTDRNSADSVMATTQDYLFPLFVDCVPNADELEGSACALSSSAEAIVPGAITEGKRSIWQIDNLRVFDAGADQDARTLGDNTIFARPGIFVP